MATMGPPSHVDSIVPKTFRRDSCNEWSRLDGEERKVVDGEVPY